MALPPVPADDVVFPQRKTPSIDRPTEVFEVLGNSVSDIQNVALMTVVGFESITHIHTIASTLDQASAVETREQKARLQEMARHSAFASAEMERDFPILRGQVAIAVWGQVEAFAEDFAAVAIDLDPKPLLIGKLAKLRIQIGDYLNAGDDRNLVVARAVLQSDQIKDLNGVDRFEELLLLLGVEPLPNDLPASIRVTLNELCNVRNVLVHRRGVADRKFLKGAYPAGSKMGTAIKITPLRSLQYGAAAIGYGAIVLRRLLKQRNEAPDRVDYLGHMINVFTHNAGASGSAEFRDKPSEAPA